ncbi:MAG TPA: hypothetical protein VFS08_10605 [Gemmatimonadaceae bacterium]|nr:hypothetical protein [Gemmatimonadaceae bacterium]
MADRIKAALSDAGLNISRLAEEWGLNRGALTNRINGGDMAEPELERLAQRVGRPVWWLRYGDVAAQGATAGARALPAYWQGVNYAVLEMLERITALQREVNQHTIPMPKKAAYRGTDRPVRAVAEPGAALPPATAPEPPEADAESVRQQLQAQEALEAAAREQARRGGKKKA